MKLTYKFRVKDKHSLELRNQSELVNFVWNYCNETQRKAATSNRQWLSAYDLIRLTTGSTKAGLDLSIGTVQKTCMQYVTSRTIHNKPWLKWRTKKSLGWVPFNTDFIKFKNGLFYFRNKPYYVWLTRNISENVKFKDGNFNADSRGRWYLNITIDIPEVNRNNTAEIGIDLGLKNLVTCSNGTKYENLSYYRKSEIKLATTQRANKKKQVRTVHAKIVNQRKDFLHKVTTDLTDNYGLIIVGDVSSSKLAKTNLAKSVYDASWYSFKQMLSYKSIRNGGKYIEVSEMYTTQTCSNCGALPDSRPRGIAGLGIREWTCSECGTTHDRDVNAAKNILALGHKSLVEGAL